jgi:ParB family transcriptional regulator, chromosome partitioning protein
MLTKIDLDQLHESAYQGRLLPETTEEKLHRLESLMKSIELNGLMQPITVRKLDDGYEIIDGHRRVEATRELNKSQISAIVKNVTEREAQVLSIIGNLQRENLTNIEKAIAFKKILDSKIFKDKREFSKAIGMDETFVGDLINTVNMDSRIIDDLVTNKTTNDVRLLRAIRRVEDVDEEQYSEKQWAIYQAFKAKGLSRADVIELVRMSKEPPKKSYTVVKSAHKIHIEFHKKFTAPQRNLIRNMLDEKLAEIIKQVVGEDTVRPEEE